MSFKNITRRNFLKTTGTVTSAFLLGSRLMPKTNFCYGQNSSSIVKVFAVGDAHFGWNDSRQPSPEYQAQLMDTIMNRFPDLDAFVDTGDAHHNYAKDADKGKWTDVIPGRCGTSLFYYAAGNHEVDKWNADYDPEWLANKLGSVECKPYYSFDIKGVHFVSLPQLNRVNYISEEEFEWLKLDLTVNRGKTTVIFTHNSLDGTTEYHDDRAYRQVINSQDVLNLINQYPNVLAWMHGHNHTYEVVPQNGKVYVSLGRIGGFALVDVEPYQLGGFYLEVGSDYLTVRGYNAESNQFFDEISSNYSHLNHTISGATSLDLTAKPAISYGFGGARDGQITSIINHHCITNNTNALLLGGSEKEKELTKTGQGKRELFISGTDTPLFNFNRELNWYAQRPSGGKIFPGFNIPPGQYEWLDPDVRLLANETGHSCFMVPMGGVARKSYFRCPPGKTYKLRIKLDAHKGGQNYTVKCRLYDNNQNTLQTITKPSSTLASGVQTIEYDFDTNGISNADLIYNNLDSDNKVQVGFEVVFSKFSEEIDIQRAEVLFADADGQTSTVNPSVTADGKVCSYNGSLSSSQIKSFELPTEAPKRSTYKVSAGGNMRLSWLVRQTAPAWQVRNAPVEDKGYYFEVGPIRNDYSAKQEIVIVPTSQIQSPFVHRLRHISKAKVFPMKEKNKKLVTQIEKFSSGAELDAVCPQEPKHVNGTAKWSYNNGILTAKINSGGKVVIYF